MSEKETNETKLTLTGNDTIKVKYLLLVDDGHRPWWKRVWLWITGRSSRLIAWADLTDDTPKGGGE